MYCMSENNIGRLQIVEGLGDPFVTSWPVLEYTLHGVKLQQAKQVSTRQRARLPITPAIMRLHLTFWQSQRHNPDYIMLWAAC